MILFGLFMLAVTSGIHVYIWKRLIKNTRPKRSVKIAGTIIIVALALSMPLTMFFGRIISPQWAAFLSPVPLLWMGTMLFIVVFLLFFDLFFLGRFLYFKILHLTSPPTAASMKTVSSDAQRDILDDSAKRDSLRKLAAVGTLAISGTLTTAAFATAKKGATVISLRLTLSKLPRKLNGLKIVQLSDIHMGLTLDRHFLQNVVSQVNELNPDIVVITGDLVDGSVKMLQKEVAPLFELSPSMGTYFVTGNHEYYSGVHEWNDFLSKKGITVLDNKAVSIGTDDASLLLAGVNDYHANRVPDAESLDLEKALSTRLPDQEVILLCHQPKIIYDAAKADVGLILSGHTHGGQIWPFNYLVRLQQPFLKGLIKYNDRTQLYINQGTGYWGPPMRLGTVSEISLFTLYRKEAA